MEEITVKAEFLFELNSFNEWVNRVPSILPAKIRAGEQWLWIDKNGNNLELGRDFQSAKKANTYPVKVYRLQCVASAHGEV